MLLWGDELLDCLTGAASRARSGRPTALLLSGEAGIGKSSCLDELVARTPDFSVLAADGLQDARTPYGLLEQLEVVPPRPADGGLPTVMSAAGALRDRLDALALAGPVMIRLDDLHWADPESVDVLAWVLRRTAGDRLLVAAATRDVSPGRFRTWDTVVADPARGVRVALPGLSPEGAEALVRRRWPQASAELADRLWRHTSGNPLFLTSLLNEQDPAELASAEVLPAPVAFDRAIGRRLARLTAGAREMLFAAAVLGDGWSSLADVAAVGDTDPAHAADSAQELADSELVRVRTVGAVPVLRFPHALVRSAVYLQTPLPRRRDLHARAVRVVAAEPAVLHHLIGAADQYDDELADRLEAFATDRYAHRSFREAAGRWSSSSRLTPDPARRERRWLEAVFCSVMARDLDRVGEQLDDVLASSAGPRRSLVLAALAVAERRHRDAVVLLEPVAGLPVDAVDRVTRYRVQVLLAWSRICAGFDTAAVAEALARAAAATVPDAGVAGLETVAGGHVRIRQSGVAAVLAQLDAMPQQAPSVPAELTPALAWRGTLRASMGLDREAVSDLREVTHRIEDGETDLGAGSFHAFLGLAQWLDGDWSRARITFGKAVDITGAFAHPMVLALAPLVDIGEGRFDDADRLLARASDDVLAAPYPEARMLVVTTLLVRAHAGGSATDQAELLARLRGTGLEPPATDQATPVLLLHLGQGFVWAGELDAADDVVRQLARVRPCARWIPAVRYWLAGLVAAARGDRREAAARYARARAAPGLDLPLYRAHLLADSARLADAHDPPAAAAFRQQAEDVYRRLGARPYVERMGSEHAARTVEAGRTATAGRPTGPVLSAPLTERERDVLSLVVSGLSYAQIARELFVTQSTVGYHLGNIYDKAGVRSRHRLTELARSCPELLTTAGFS